MALKNYQYRNSTYQFDDQEVPTGAVLVEVKAPAAVPGPSDEQQAEEAARLAAEAEEQKQAEEAEAAKQAENDAQKQAEEAKNKAHKPKNK